jgi:hypothetical protein
VNEDEENGEEDTTAAEFDTMWNEAEPRTYGCCGKVTIHSFVSTVPATISYPGCDG